MWRVAAKGFRADLPVPSSAEQLQAWWREALAHPDRLLAIDEVQKIVDWSA